jgi:hypothetical protein
MLHGKRGAEEEEDKVKDRRMLFEHEGNWKKDEHMTIVVGDSSLPVDR